MEEVQKKMLEDALREHGSLKAEVYLWAVTQVNPPSTTLRSNRNPPSMTLMSNQNPPRIQLW